MCWFNQEFVPEFQGNGTQDGVGGCQAHHTSPLRLQVHGFQTSGTTAERHVVSPGERPKREKSRSNASAALASSAWRSSAACAFAWHAIVAPVVAEQLQCWVARRHHRTGFTMKKGNTRSQVASGGGGEGGERGGAGKKKVCGLCVVVWGVWCGVWWCVVVCGTNH